LMSLFFFFLAFYVQSLLGGAILTQGTRTLSAILRTLGLAHLERFQNVHRVLNRDQWSGIKTVRVLWEQLLAAFAPCGRLVLGLDDFLERRRGAEIKALGIYHDSARSSRSFFVKSSGLRWLSLQLMVRIPWAERIWGLPVLTALAPSQRFHRRQGRRHQTLWRRARQLLAQVRRWAPQRDLLVVADSQYAIAELLAWGMKLLKPVFFITRFRLNGALYQPPPPVRTRRRGRPRLKGSRLPPLRQVLEDRKTRWTRRRLGWYSQGKRLVEYCTGLAVWHRGGRSAVPLRWVLVRDPRGKFQPQAFVSTDLRLSAPEVLRYFMYRWPMEVTFQETRAHLGIDGQRQWNSKAIARTTPCLLGLFSLVTLMAHRLQGEGGQALSVRTAAWYPKELPTFSDALTWVQKMIWRDRNFWRSALPADGTKCAASAKTLEDLLDCAA